MKHILTNPWRFQLLRVVYLFLFAQVLRDPRDLRLHPNSDEVRVSKVERSSISTNGCVNEWKVLEGSIRPEKLRISTVQLPFTRQPAKRRRGNKGKCPKIRQDLCLNEGTLSTNTGLTALSFSTLHLTSGGFVQGLDERSSEYGRHLLLLDMKSCWPRIWSVPGFDTKNACKNCRLIIKLITEWVH